MTTKEQEAIESLQAVQKTIDGFIKICENNANSLDKVDHKIVVAAIYTLSLAVRTMMQERIDLLQMEVPDDNPVKS